MKTLEVQLAEANALVASLTAENTNLKESVRIANVATASGFLKNLMTEAKLPAPGIELLTKQFEGAVKTDNMKEAVDNLAKCLVESHKIVKNLGANDRGTPNADGSRPAAEVRESSIKALVQSGISKAEAELMVE